MDTPRITPIAGITQENTQVKTFWFDYELQSNPGQFVMLWIPEVDQKPFSIAYDTGTRFGVAVFPVGPFSSQLCEMKVGERIGITGPYGRSFTIYPKTHYITVGGGYGAGPLGMVAEKIVAGGSTVDFCIGAKTKELLLFEDRIKKLPGVSIHVATDDGSRGHHGYVTNILEQLLQQYSTSTLQHAIHVSTCGPELMEKKVLEICNTYKVDCEISIERYMKCGFGVCGQCCVDDSGMRMCVEGPVVNRDMANQIHEFGKYHRDKSGTRVQY